MVNLPDSVFAKPKPKKTLSEVPKLPARPEPLQQQQVVDEDFLRDAFCEPEKRAGNGPGSPLKSGQPRAETGSPLKPGQPRVESPLKPESRSPLKREPENPFLRNLELKEEGKEEFEVVSDENRAAGSEETKEEREELEDHEVYEAREEEEPEEEPGEEEEEGFVQVEAGLNDILEASNENSENPSPGKPGPAAAEDEVRSDEEEEKGEGSRQDGLREKLEEATKREKELRNLIELKVRDCEKVLGRKTFEEVIGFFREKLNVRA